MARDLLAVKGVKNLRIDWGYGWLEIMIEGGYNWDIATTILAHIADGIETRGNTMFRGPKFKTAEAISPEYPDVETMAKWIRNPEVRAFPLRAAVLTPVRFSRPSTVSIIPKIKDPVTFFGDLHTLYVDFATRAYVRAAELLPWLIKR